MTICTKGHKCYFGEITGEEMHLNESGIISKNNWVKICQSSLNIQIDEFIIMPNHIHGIIRLNENSHGRDAINRVSTGGITKTHNPMLTCNSLSYIVRRYKSRVAYEIRKTRPDFTWQPRFFDHVIQNEIELNIIRDYIINNSLKWWFDEENPDKKENIRDASQRIGHTPCRRDHFWKIPSF